MNQVYKNLALWMVIGLIVILLFTVFQGAQQSGQEQPNFSEFLRAVEQNRVESVVIRGNHVTYSLKDSAQTQRTYIVDYPDLIKMLLQRLYHGVESQGVGYHQQPIRTAGRFDDVNRLTRCAGHGLFDYDGLAGRERGT